MPVELISADLDEHLDDTIEEYLVGIAEQGIEALRNYTEERIKEFEKESEKGVVAIKKNIAKYSEK